MANYYTFDTKVKASSIWEGTPDYEDKGNIPGLVRGYNIEVKRRDGKIVWLSCDFIYGEPEEHFNNDFHQWYYETHEWTPTGRITFRGYGYEAYNEDIGEYIEPCDENGNIIER